MMIERVAVLVLAMRELEMLLVGWLLSECHQSRLVMLLLLDVDLELVLVLLLLVLMGPNKRGLTTESRRHEIGLLVLVDWVLVILVLLLVELVGLVLLLFLLLLLILAEALLLVLASAGAGHQRRVVV